MSHETLLSPAQIHQIEKYLDQEDTIERFRKQGELLYRVFQTDRGGRNNVSAQVRNLQQVTTSATRLSDIEDFIKNQLGKGTGAAKSWRQDSLGSILLKELADEVRKKAAELANNNPQHQIQIRLRLARGWVRAIVSEYLFCKAQAEVGTGQGVKK